MKIRVQIISILLLISLAFCSCTREQKQDETSAVQKTGSMELLYAQQFTVDFLQDGCSLITVGGEDRFLLVPEETAVPEGIDSSVTVLQQPLDSIYVASSSVMDLFLRMDALDSVSMTSTSHENWTIPQIRDLVREDEITYVGKYSAPDYEAVLDLGCDLAVENTMIWHNPSTKEQLERLGIPVLVERSSYEAHPLGRVEWIKLYGLLTGHLEEAEAFFEQSVRTMEEVEAQEASGKTVAFFYVTTSGAVNVRRPNDYIAKMIEIAGGTYLFPAAEIQSDNALSTMEIQMETFYAQARDADILIYNSTVQGDIESIDDLLAISPVFSDFKAVQEGNVWCTGQNMFQQTGGAADMLRDLHRIFEEEEGELVYLHEVN